MTKPLADQAGRAPDDTWDARTIRARTHPPDASQRMIAMADGWQIRCWHRPAPQKPRAHILFMGGRGDFTEKYLESFADWHDAGYAVSTFDWRGQGKSGRLAPDRHVGHAASFDGWITDLQALVAQLHQDPAVPLVAMGHSMGGHLLLRALAEGAIAPAGAVLVAPMLGFSAPFPLAMGEGIALAMCSMKGAQAPAWKVSEKPGSPIAARQALLTHDARRYADEQWWLAQDAELALGPASWGWVAAAYRSMRWMGGAGVVEHVAVPVLVLNASKDALVGAAAVRTQAARLQNGVYQEYGAEAAHELLREVDAVRGDALARIERFIAGLPGVAAHTARAGAPG